MNNVSLRKEMVETQLKPRGIADRRVLDAFFKVERHRFIPENALEHAYADYPVPIGEGQTISQPYIVALMTQSLELTASHRVLEIGTGSGYQTAILAELAGDVYTIERFPELSQKAQKLLGELGYSNIHYKIGDGTLGWKEEAPFDRILLTAYANQVPQPLLDQLADNGKLLLPLGEMFSQMLTVVEKRQKSYYSLDICPCVFVPLVGRYGVRDT